MFIFKILIYILIIAEGIGFIAGGGMWFSSSSKAEKWQPVIVIIISIGVTIFFFCKIVSLVNNL